MGFNKRYIDKERIVDTFSHKGIFGLRDLFGLPDGLTGLSKVDAIITQDDFSDMILTAYQEGRENDVAMDLTQELLNKQEVIDVGEEHTHTDKWYIDQYNRNRHPKDYITNISQIKT